jgi:hypothetical protein
MAGLQRICAQALGAIHRAPTACLAAPPPKSEADVKLSATVGFERLAYGAIFLQSEA